MPAEGEADADGDGLTDAQEAALGTDPDVADSDEDGHDDADEAAEATNPLSVYSHHLPEGDYLVGACPAAPAEDVAGPTGEGSFETYTWEAYQDGDVVRNWQGWDTYEQEVSLYNFCGNYMLLTLSASWCGPCQELAADLTEVQEQVREDFPNFVVFELLYQNTRGNTPTTKQLTAWKDEFELDGIPVVGPEDAADPELTLFEKDGYIPTSVILSPEMEVLSIDEYLTSARDIKTALETDARGR